MKFKSEVLTQASGSIGGTTYSHNRAGLYRRARSIPVNPNTTRQVEVRTAFTDLVTRWIDTLIPAERDAWDLYGANVPVTDALGDEINLTGQNWYIGNNTPLLQSIANVGSTMIRIDPGPTIFDRGDFTTPSFLAGVAVGIAITFDNTDAWANEDNAALYVFQGQPMNPSRNFFKGPWRMVAAIEGDSVTAPTSPLAISGAALGFALAAGQNMSVGFSVGRADGRLTSRRTVGPQLTVA